MANDFFSKGLDKLDKGEWKEAKHDLELAAAYSPSAEVFENLGKACWWVNDFQNVFEYRQKAFELFLQNEDSYGASRNAAWLGIDYLELKGEFAIANGWFIKAEKLLEDKPERWELGLVKLLKARLAFNTEKSNQNAINLLDESISISERTKYDEGIMIGKALKGFILTTEGKIEQGMSLLDEATLMATMGGSKDANLITITCCFLIDACELVRDFDRAGQWCKKVMEICNQWNYVAKFSTCRIQYASFLIWKGEWKEAEEELEAANEELKVLRPSQVNASTVRLSDLRRKQGKWDEAEKLLKQVRPGRYNLLINAALFIDKGDIELGTSFLQRYLRHIPSKEKINKLDGLELLIRIYIKTEKFEEATHVLDELKSLANSINTMAAIAATLFSEGLFYQALHENEKAKHCLEEAVEFYNKMEVPYESAVVQLALSEVLISLNEVRQAEYELQLAMGTFQKLGAQKDLEKAKELFKKVFNINIKTPTDFSGRELEVLKLIAEGKSNEEIAEALFLSVRTVEKHLTNLYLKMGIQGKSARTYAATYAIKHNLIPH
jgi:ATP/maltotriose-dependent transcriptional regulator MalT